MKGHDAQKGNGLRSHMAKTGPIMGLWTGLPSIGVVEHELLRLRTACSVRASTWSRSAREAVLFVEE
jgi:hypothetical protein